MPVSAVRWKRDLEKGRGCVRASPNHVVLPLEESGVVDCWNMPILGAASAAACPSSMKNSPGSVCLCHCSKSLRFSGTGIGKGWVSAWSWGRPVDVFGERSPSYQGLCWHFCCHHKLLVWCSLKWKVSPFGSNWCKSVELPFGEQRCVAARDHEEHLNTWALAASIFSFS